MSRADITPTRDDALVLLGGLNRLRRQHYECEDCWYSCPRSEDGCCDENKGDDCTCGADKHNALIDELVKLIPVEVPMPDTPLDRAALLGAVIEALTDDDISQANEDVLEAARKVRDYFGAQGIEVRRG